ncbi:NAD(P)H-hydrate dehydratase [Sphingomonas aliaeris]|uniref:ADP-dependent (S)-NAD(P)H-hydrate dehydratase n=1 Tax=Sphingomonas aliaeris TaxID=2759526 RepID=A0A974NTH7_9SPHN|nr:NAD(P)H-hydrate dehydratase [Sphingomonas aliaeris]QQV76636.1 NAD(P)H-hydrate dehydratase [Sphingomonas aliaeris]
MSYGATPVDSAWIAANPLPVHGGGTTKNSRGRVLAIGGSGRVPGAIRLTGEAALRVGAGKLQMATIASAATMLGLFVPEAAAIALPEDDDREIGEGAGPIVEQAMARCDTVVLGPGIARPEVAARLLGQVISADPGEMILVVDAMPIGALRDLESQAAALSGRLILTPHYGEMAVLAGCEEDAVADNPERFACDAAARFGAIVVLKGSSTVIAGPDGAMLHYGGGGTGLATGGSGDVLAGAIAGLVARGASPRVAAGWGVWLHGQSGRRVATMSGPIGFLARELPVEFPRLLPQ